MLGLRETSLPSLVGYTHFVFSGPGNDVGHLEFNGCTGILRTQKWSTISVLEEIM